jgi:hypothetical protein
MKSSFVLLALAVGIGACSSKEEAPDPYATVGQFCLAWGKSACTPEAVSACAGNDATDALTQACITSQAAFCETLLPTTGYSSAQAAECLAAVQSAYSDGRLNAADIAIVRHRGAPCNHLVKGPQPKGGSCTQDDDCDTLQNYQCVMKGDEGTCQIGKLVANGTPCDAPDAVCNDKFYCDGNCVAYRTVGARCATDSECDPALTCAPDPVDAPRCTSKVAPDKCKEDSDCPSDTPACDIPLGADSGKCVKNIVLSPSDSQCQDLQ